MTNFRSAVSLTCCCTTYSAFSWLSCWHWWEHILYYVYIHIQWYFAKGRVTFKLGPNSCCRCWLKTTNVRTLHREHSSLKVGRVWGACRKFAYLNGITDTVVVLTVYCFLSDGKIGTFTHIWYVWFDCWFACLSVYVFTCVLSRM